MNILNLFKRRPKFKSGALPDDRTEKEQKKDYEHKEVAQVPVVDWKEDWSYTEIHRYIQGKYDNDLSYDALKKNVKKAMEEN